MANKKKQSERQDALADPVRLAAQLDTYDKARKTFLDWVDRTLVQGEDVLLLQGNRKPILTKQGAEKIDGAMNWRPTFARDAETWAMLGNRVGVICYRCVLVDQITGKEVGEGRGARDVQQDSGDVNTSIKMAQKSGQVDATIRAAGLSEKLTQDLDDRPVNGGKGVVTPKARETAAGAPSDTTPIASTGTATSPAAPPDLPPVEEPIPPATMKLLRQMAVADGGYPNWQQRREAIKAYLADLRLTRLDGLSKAAGDQLVALLEQLPPPPKTNGGLTHDLVRADLQRVLDGFGLPGERAMKEAEAFIAKWGEAANLEGLSPERALAGVDELRQLGNASGIGALKLAMDRVARGEP